MSKMKNARIQNSLKDLNNDIGNCEKQLSRVLKVKDSHLETGRTQSVARNANTRAGYRQPNISHLSRSTTKQGDENLKIRRSRSSSKGQNDERNVICKEVIGNKNTTVEVVIRTESSKKRSRSVQANQTHHEIPTRDTAGRNRSLNFQDWHSNNGPKNSSWGHILQQQSSVSQRKRNGPNAVKAKTCAALQYSSSDDDHSSLDREKRVSNNPPDKIKLSHYSSHHIANSNVRTSDIGDSYFSMFNPLRTMNFLVKELRGKVHKDCDENMQRIVEDMEKALSCIPSDVNQSSPSTQTANKVVSPQIPLGNASSKSRNSISESGGARQALGKGRMKSHSHKKDETESTPNLVERLLSTVSRISKITGFPENAEQLQSPRQGGMQSEERLPPDNIAAENVQTQLEQGCKQLEDTCRQMEETCKNLRQQKFQLLEDLKSKSQQLETMVGKNQQLTTYAADIRQEMIRVQQASTAAQQEHEITKQKLLSHQRELEESNNHLKKRLGEIIQDNERISTELQLCRLEKDKMHILMSNKDLEVARLKKEIVDINTLVTEQLTNIYTQSGKKCSLDDLGKMMQAFSRLHDTIDSANSTLEPKPNAKEGFKNHIGDGEGSRSRPICSSPTSSVESSLYSSWQLMSDITADEPKEKKTIKPDEGTKETVPRKPKDSGINSPTPVDLLFHEAMSKTDDTESRNRREHDARELKVGLQNMFHQLKKETSEAINVTLPSPPRAYNNVQETLGVSQWTELSASESTVLFHSSDDSDLDNMA